MLPGTPIFHCTRPVSRGEAERALLEYFAGWKTWKNRFPWERLKGGAAPGKAGGKSRVEAILDGGWAVAVVFAVFWVWKDSRWLGGKGEGAGADGLWVVLTAVWAVSAAIRAGLHFRKRKMGGGGDGGRGGTAAARQDGDGGGREDGRFLGGGG